MSHLIDLIQRYRDERGQPSWSSIARSIGVAPQTISSWRRRGIRKLPEHDTLVALARVLQVDYATEVLPAVMRDIGYLDAGKPQDLPPDEGEVRGA